MKHTTSSSFATLNDYQHFHGMLCRPSTAFRCIQSFTGSVVFAPAPEEQNKDTLADVSSILNVTSYYALVVFSCTGLLTMMGWTECHMSRNCGDTAWVVPFTAESNLHLVVQPEVLAVLQTANPEATQFTLRRHFEYSFGRGRFSLSVMMLHLACSRGRLHLVEVYRFHNPFVQRMVRYLQRTILGWMMR